jgi:hypothetical protein
MKLAPLHEPLRTGDRITERGLLLSYVSCWEPDCPRDHFLSGDLDLYLEWTEQKVEVHPFFVAIDANIVREYDINTAITQDYIRQLLFRECPLTALLPITIHPVTGVNP